jgi:hypothetical protein
MPKSTNFRRWVHELWMRNCDEHSEYGELRYTQEQYFQQYKYWLKREYKYQRSQNA